MIFGGLLRPNRSSYGLDIFFFFGMTCSSLEIDIQTTSLLVLLIQELCILNARQGEGGDFYSDSLKSRCYH